MLTHGPVHEAFAGTVTFDAQPGIIVPGVPPAAIEELPPEHKPDGADVAWIPGYWTSDDDNRDFLWVSGTWRALPPGRQWVSGYWRVFAQPLEQFRQAQNSQLRFQPLNSDDRQRFGQLGQEVRTHREARQKLEAEAIDLTAERPARMIQPPRIRLPRSPYIARGSDELGTDLAPPKTHVLPEPDPSVIPKSRSPIEPRTTLGPQIRPPQPQPELQPQP